MPKPPYDPNSQSLIYVDPLVGPNDDPTTELMRKEIERLRKEGLNPTVKNLKDHEALTGQTNPSKHTDYDPDSAFDYNAARYVQGMENGKWPVSQQEIDYARKAYQTYLDEQQAKQDMEILQGGGTIQTTPARDEFGRVPQGERFLTQEQSDAYQYSPLPRAMLGPDGVDPTQFRAEDGTIVSAGPGRHPTKQEALGAQGAEAGYMRIYDPMTGRYVPRIAPPTIDENAVLNQLPKEAREEYKRSVEEGRWYDGRKFYSGTGAVSGRGPSVESRPGGPRRQGDREQWAEEAGYERRLGMTPYLDDQGHPVQAEFYAPQELYEFRDGKYQPKKDVSPYKAKKPEDLKLETKETETSDVQETSTSAEDGKEKMVASADLTNTSESRLPPVNPLAAIMPGLLGMVSNDVPDDEEPYIKKMPYIKGEQTEGPDIRDLIRTAELRRNDAQPEILLAGVPHDFPGVHAPPKQTDHIPDPAPRGQPADAQAPVDPPAALPKPGAKDRLTDLENYRVMRETADSMGISIPELRELYPERFGSIGNYGVGSLGKNMDNPVRLMHRDIKASARDAARRKRENHLLWRRTAGREGVHPQQEQLLGILNDPNQSDWAKSVAAQSVLGGQGTGATPIDVNVAAGGLMADTQAATNVRTLFGPGAPSAVQPPTTETVYNQMDDQITSYKNSNTTIPASMIRRWITSLANARAAEMGMQAPDAETRERAAQEVKSRVDEFYNQTQQANPGYEADVFTQNDGPIAGDRFYV